MCYYHFVTYKVLFHSDAAIKSLLAAETLRTHQLFLRTFYYVNDITLLSPHLFQVAFGWLGIEPYTHFSTALASACSSSILLCMLCLFLRSIACSKETALLSLVLVFSGVSKPMAENVFGMNAYATQMSLTLAVLLLIISGWGAWQNHSWRRFIVIGAGLTLVLVLGIVSGPRVLLTIALPALMALGLTMLIASLSETPEHSLIRLNFALLLIVAGASLVGLLAFAFVKSKVLLVGNVAQGYASFEGVMKNLELFIAGYLHFLDALPDPRRSPYSIYGVLTAYRALAALALFLTPFWAISRYRRLTNPKLRFVTLFYACGFGTLVYFYLFGNVAVALESHRYFCVSMMLGVVVCVVHLQEFREELLPKRILAAFILLLPLVLSSWVTLTMPALQVDLENHSLSLKRNWLEPVADYLVAHELHCGYATYWNAAATTVLSNGRSQVRPVLVLENQRIVPYRHLSIRDSYLPESFRGRTFLLLSNQEFTSLRRDLLALFLGQPESVDRVGDYWVIVYSFNIAGRLPGWIEQPAILSKYSPSDVRAFLRFETVSVNVKPGQLVKLRLRIENTGKKVLSTGGPFPITIGFELYDQNQRRLKELPRLSLSQAIHSGQAQEVVVPVEAPAAGAYRLKADLIQEGVFWFGAVGSSSAGLVELIVQ